MPRTDRELARSALTRELVGCGFTSEDAHAKALQFSSANITALDVYTIKDLVGEVRKKYEARFQEYETRVRRMDDALKTEWGERHEFIQAIKKLVEKADTPEIHASNVLSPETILLFKEQMNRA